MSLDEKTEVLWFGTVANLRKISPHVSSIRVGSTVVTPTTVVRNLRVILLMRERVSGTWFYHLRRLRSVRRQLGRDVTAQLVSCFCNVILAGLPTSTLAPLQTLLCNRSSGCGPTTPRPRTTGPPGIALVTYRQEDRLQAVCWSTKR